MSVRSVAAYREGEAPAEPQRATIHVARRLTRITRRFALPWSRAVRAFRFVLIAATVIASVVAPHKTSAQDAFADAVTAYAPGVNGGFNAADLPNIVLGPPHGSGAMQGSFDVLALGIGGAIVLRFDAPVICDGPGGDFTVFENAFHSGSPAGPVFAEYGYVAVSQDGEHFTEFPYDASTHVGLAGQTPVLSNPDNDIDPLDPTMSGGDAFDLAAVGLAWAAYVRITDVGGAIADPGDLPQFTVAPNAGFDLDAIAAVHACDPGALPTPTATGTTVPISATPTRTRAPSMAGDLDRDGSITDADVRQLIAELFDGDGDTVSAVAGGSVVSGVEADVNGDGRITAADLAGVRGLREGQ